MAVTIASANQAAAYSRGETPPPELIREGVLSIPLPMPSRGIPFSLAYAIEDARGDVHLIDSGMDAEHNFERMAASLGMIGRALDDVATITVTHLHPDHIGLAGRVRSASGAALRLHRADAAIMRSRGTFAGESSPGEMFDLWQVPDRLHGSLEEWAGKPASPIDVPVDVELVGGERLPAPGRALTVHHTPGHTIGHVCVRDEDERLLFTGDHLLAVMFPGLGLSGAAQGWDPISDCRRSLEAMAAFEDDEACPGHGYRFTGIRERCAQTRDHHARRTSQVADVLQATPDATVWEVASHLTWTAGWGNLEGFHLFSALAQTALHVGHVMRTSRA